MNNKYISETEARVNVTYDGQNGDMPDTVHVGASDRDLRAWAGEAIATGSIPGIRPVRASFSDHVVDRFNASATRPYNLIQIRPKTPFG